MSLAFSPATRTRLFLSLAFTLALTTQTALAICPENQTNSCVTPEGCAGTTTCDGEEWSECAATNPSCAEAPPTSFVYTTSGIGAGKELWVEGVANPSPIDLTPTYLFTSNQKNVVINAIAADSHRGIKSVKLTGYVTVTCMTKRTSVWMAEHQNSITYTLSGENTSTTALPSRSATMAVAFKSYDEETRCVDTHPLDPMLPYRIEVVLHAQTTNGANQVVKTPVKRLVFVQSFKFATFNIKHGTIYGSENVSSIPLLPGYMNGLHSVDVVVLQETNNDTVYRLSTEPGINELARHVRSAGNNDLSIFSKFPFSHNEQVFFTLPLSGYIHSWQLAILQLGGFDLRVANLHLIADSVAQPRNIDAIPYRRQEIDEVLLVMAPPGMPSIIAGDLNAPVYTGAPASAYRYEWQLLANLTPYAHTCIANGCQVTPELDPRYNLDQIWVWADAPGLEILDAYTAFDAPVYADKVISDHRMQVTRLRIRE